MGLSGLLLEHLPTLYLGTSSARSDSTRDKKWNLCCGICPLPCLSPKYIADFLFWPKIPEICENHQTKNIFEMCQFLYNQRQRTKPINLMWLYIFVAFRYFHIGLTMYFLWPTSSTSHQDWGCVWAIKRWQRQRGLCGTSTLCYSGSTCTLCGIVAPQLVHCVV